MLTPTGLKVLEYNVRFGDPETQSMMLLVSPDCDLAEVLLACVNGTLASIDLLLLPGYACNVFIASEGYPGAYKSGDLVRLDEAPAGIQLSMQAQKLSMAS
jgi:phosphoribosylamine-glycine ligase